MWFFYYKNKVERQEMKKILDSRRGKKKKKLQIDIIFIKIFIPDSFIE